ncbi:hypothetical protein ML462_00680 [Gramella lutea]|uniref:Uncharacterized protein n=1 Tax=Christiangramia lutea TaxID=1607951 RepID=A0A9X1V083_9FLAO|nr:hypothetical protein [Christiangramia lutea]MCH4821674.1 hypothetical protein [Christiangramia lutea]
MFGHFKYTEKQREIIDRCKKKNNPEFQKWFFHNLWFPIGIIILSAFFILVFRNAQEFKNHLIGGSISLLGINILFAMSSYLIRKKEYKNDNLKEDAINLFQKLSDYKITLILIGTVLYFLPAFYKPDNLFQLILILIIGLIVLGISIRVGSHIFIIRDEMYQKAYELETYDDYIRKDGGKKHGKGWN